MSSWQIILAPAGNLVSEQLREAIRSDEPEFTSFLVSNSAHDIDARLFGYEDRAYMGATCLHLAAHFGSSRVIRKLLELGADPNITDVGQKIPVERLDPSSPYTQEITIIFQEIARRKEEEKTNPRKVLQLTGLLPT